MIRILLLCICLLTPTTAYANEWGWSRPAETQVKHVITGTALGGATMGVCTAWFQDGSKIRCAAASWAAITLMVAVKEVWWDSPRHYGGNVYYADIIRQSGGAAVGASIPLIIYEFR